MRLYQTALVVACLLLLRSAADVTADGPSNGPASPAVGSGTVESIRFGPPPASLAASLPQTAVALYPPGTTAICKDLTSSMNSDSTSVCAAHGGLLDWLGPVPASAIASAAPANSGATSAIAALPSRVSPQSLDSAPVTVSLQQGHPADALSPSAAPESQSNSAPPTPPRAVSVQGPVSIQAPKSLPVGAPVYVQGPSGARSSSESGTPPAPSVSIASSETSASGPATSNEPASGAVVDTPPPATAEAPQSSSSEPPRGDAAESATAPSSEPATTGVSEQHLTVEPPSQGAEPAPESATAPEMSQPQGARTEATTETTAAAPANSNDSDAPTTPDSPRTATCVDGTDSYNADKAAACSQHGGVADWFGTP
jgi:hypothetical protein